MNGMTYSVIVPVYNEEGNVISLYNDIVSAMEAIGKTFEILFIDDGSSDGTYKKLKGLKNTRLIRFRKNFGQTAALDAGFKNAKGDFFITMDGDGQNPPSEISKLIAEMDRGDYDLVSGWREKRKDTFMKRFVSRGAYRLRSVIVKDHIKDSGCSLKIYRRECFDDLDLFGEMHRFIPALLYWKGFTIGEVSVAHKPRTSGVTKYNWKRTLKGFIDMLSVWFWRKFSRRPLHLFGGFGILILNIGLLLLALLVALRFFAGYSLSDKIWPLIAVLLILVGFQSFATGILADIMTKNHYGSSEKPYSIKEIIEQ